MSTAPFIKDSDIEANIADEYYFTAYEGYKGAGGCDMTMGPLNFITICVIILRNGYKIVGVNEGPVSVENFDPAIGRQYAREKAVNQIWPLMGYELKSQLANVIEYAPFTWEDIWEIQSTHDALNDGTMFRIKAKAGNEFNFVIADTSKMSQLQIKDQIIIRINQQIQEGAKP